MGSLDARLGKLEASAGQSDEAHYWQAEFDLQPAVYALAGGAMKKTGQFRYMDEWMELRSTLPPYPKHRECTPAERDRAVAEMLEKLDSPREWTRGNFIDPYGLDELTEEIRAQEYAYLRQRGDGNG